MVGWVAYQWGQNGGEMFGYVIGCRVDAAVLVFLLLFFLVVVLLYCTTA